MLDLEKAVPSGRFQAMVQRDLCAENGPEWFAIYTTCRHEKRVAEHFASRTIEHYLPVYLSDRKWRDGSRVTLELPLFPCYIFACVSRSERWRILEVPGALAIVGGAGRNPVSLPQASIDALRAGLKEKRVEPHPLTTVGQRVRICTGPFAGMEGIVARKKSGFRVVLTLELIMQSIAVEIAETELEPVNDAVATSLTAA